MGNPEALLVKERLDDVEFVYGAEEDELGRSIFVTGPVPERVLERTLDFVELSKGAEDGKLTLILDSGNPDIEEDVGSQGGVTVVELPYGTDDDDTYVEERISVTSGIEVKIPEVDTVDGELPILAEEMTSLGSVGEGVGLERELSTL